MPRVKTNYLSVNLWPKIFAILIIVALASPYEFGMWAIMPVQVPVERLLNNVNNYIKEHPRDPQGYYVLGRLHSLAFANETGTLEVSQRSDRPLPDFLPWETVIIKRKEQSPISAKARNYFFESVRNYKLATEMAPDRAISFLGLGWMLETGATFSNQLGAPSGEEKSPRNAEEWKERALTAYRKAYELTIKVDLTQEALGPGADSAISLEAGEGIARILEKRKRTSSEEEELARVREAIENIQKKPRAVTPIIFALDRNTSLDDLLAKDNLVRFDLAGDGKPSLWPWVGPNTGILVWDPARSGRIRSGLQLFGSVTWWMSWEHGYQPLAALDNNRDGWLAGKELDGLAVWRDRNSNGISEPGEVIPADMLGIESIGVKAMAKTNGVFCNPSGLRLRNGSVLPTYDWTPVEAKRTEKNKFPILGGG